MLDYWAKKSPDRTAIDFVDLDRPARSRKLSYRELLQALLGAVDFFEDLGLKKGDSISLAYSNSPEVTILTLAAWVSGLRTAPLDLRRDSAEMMEYKLELSEAKVLVVEKPLQDERLREIKRAGRVPVIPWASRKDDPQEDHPLRDRPSKDDPLEREALVLFTSGTTAKPKGAVLTLRNLMANSDGIADWLRIDSSDRFMVLLPLHHINSTTMSLATLLRGGRVVLLSRYSNSRFWELAAKSGATLSSIVPTIVHDQLRRRKEFGRQKAKLKLSRVQLGSAPVQPAEAEEFARMTRVAVVQGYGQTETALRSTGVGWEQGKPLGRRAIKNLRSNTIGEEMKWTNVMVLRGDGAEVRAGEKGEIVVRGPVIMKEYLKNPRATEEVFRHGWFHSGDWGVWRREGGIKQFYILGRLKELIIKAGTNVSPLRVEQALLKGVQEIKRVLVIGVPDKRVGEEIAAIVVWKKTPKKIPQKVADLAAFETPKIWISVSDDDLPRTSTGKIQRVKLKAMFADQGMVAETKAHRFRPINKLETDLLEQARKIHNRRWSPMNISWSTWKEEQKDLVLIGAIDRSNGNLVGSISGRVKEGEFLGFRVSTQGPAFALGLSGTWPKLSVKEVRRYLKTVGDPVINWHKRPKAGLKRGAKVVKVVPNARPNDRAALGFGILMEYPPLAAKHELSVAEGVSLGTQLVEAALVYAQSQGVKRFRVVSRPVRLWRWALRI